MRTANPTFILCLAALMAGAAWGFAAASGVPANGCPDVAHGETLRDCPWAGVGRALARAAGGGRPVLPVLAKELPALHSRMKSDSRQREWLGLWGRSVNFDELAKEAILEPAIIEAFEEMFRVPLGPQPGHIVHAGIEHTYGYLFSQIRTPYGFKRARWVRPTLEQGFQLPEGTISPLPREGTLFSNVTYWMGRIAFRHDPGSLAILEKDKAAAARAIRDFPYSRLTYTRIEETVAVPGGAESPGRSRVVRIRTDLVPFLQSLPNITDTHVLVYSVDDPEQGGARLITAFPVEKSFVEKITDPALMGDSRPVITRYNGYVDGLTGRELSGSRQVQRQ